MAPPLCQPHFVLVPFMAQGHMIPMVDVARLLARHGVKITIFTSPLNAARFQSVLARVTQSGPPIQTIQIRFPCEEAGLPKGCEYVEMLPSANAFASFMKAIDMLQAEVEKRIEELSPKPSCIISDFCLLYTIRVATKFHIPRVSFHGMGCFCLVCTYKIRNAEVLGQIASESEYFVIPDVPDHIEFTKPQLLLGAPETPDDKGFARQIIDSDQNSYGVVVNTFEELEPAYVKEYKKVRKDKVWCIGPVSLCNEEELDKEERGNKPSVDKRQCLEWLDYWEASSVLYVCLGSLCKLPHKQMIELGLGLEASNRPFIWVIRSAESFNELEKWISESGFEERTKDISLLIKGWAPQVLILSHPSIGGFLTHCGWNSTLEGITAGVPLLTWPLFGDQFCNEKLVVKILKNGLSMGAKIPNMFGEEEKAGELVKKEDIKKIINSFFVEGEDMEQRKERARELKKRAKRAMEKEGSSNNNLMLFIQDIMQQSRSGN